MKTITEKKEIQKFFRESNLSNYFQNPNLQFQLRRYQKGEFITSPAEEIVDIIFVTTGTIRIYGLRNDGSLSPVNQQTAPILIGDIEFFQPGNPLFFTEAVTEVLCICLSIAPHKETLLQDISFLHLLCRSYIEKIKLFSSMEILAETIEERLLIYLKDFCPSHELCGMEGAALKLRCSRRQLQRVLKKLCSEGKVSKVGKGRYKLMS